MLKLGVIGTGWITKQFVDAAAATKAYTLTAVYSRHQESAQAFIDQTAPATAYTKMDDFLGSDVDVVYIASPNSLHASQALAALDAGKHVIVEKPLVATAMEFEKLDEALRKKPSLYLFEAARHVYEHNFQVVDQFTHHHPIDGATLTYMKYSSKYDAFLAGKLPNVFNPEFSGGALIDLGIYLFYDAVAWFGVPDNAVYLPHFLKSGVDGDGVARLDYDQFAVTLITGKTTNSFLPSEIYSGKQTLTMDNAAELETIKLDDQVLSTEKLANPMEAEAAYFAKAITGHDRNAFDKAWQLAKEVHQVMSILRTSANLDF